MAAEVGEHPYELHVQVAGAPPVRMASGALLAVPPPAGMPWVPSFLMVRLGLEILSAPLYVTFTVRVAGAVMAEVPLALLPEPKGRLRGA